MPVRGWTATAAETPVVRMLLLLAGIVSAEFVLARVACGEPDAMQRVVLDVKNIENASGNVIAMVYGDSPHEWMEKEQFLVRKRVIAKQHAVEICFAVPNPGYYAIVVYHDENGNQTFDKSFLGLPKEGFGFSNNPKLSMKPPQHEDVAFLVQSGTTTIDVKLSY